jgi:hypothetical protein
MELFPTTAPGKTPYCFPPHDDVSFSLRVNYRASCCCSKLTAYLGQACVLLHGRKYGAVEGG